MAKQMYRENLTGTLLATLLALCGVSVHANAQTPVADGYRVLPQRTVDSTAVAGLASPAGGRDGVLSNSMSTLGQYRAAQPAQKNENAEAILRSTRTFDRVKEVGAGPGGAGLVTSKGRQRNVAEAVEAIVPTGWSGFATDDAIKSAPKVTWRVKRRSWTYTLNRVLAQTGLQAVVHWDKKEVELMAYVPPDVPATKVSVASAEAEEFVRNGARGATAQSAAASGSSQGSVVAGAGTSASVQGRMTKLDSDAIAKMEAQIARDAEAMLMKALAQDKSQVQSGGTKAEVIREAVKPSAEPGTDVAATEVDRAETADAVATVIQAQKDRAVGGMVTRVSSVAAKNIPPVPIAALTSIRSVGTQKAGDMVVKGAGFNIPVFAALSEVSPRGWIIFSKDGALSKQMLVGWRGNNRPWMQVLDELLKSNNLTAVVRHDTKEIQIALAQ